MQKEHREWLDRMFPVRRQHHGLLGAVEEYGELLEAVTEADSDDAIGDIAIFLISYASAWGIDLHWPVDMKGEPVGDVLTSLCRLAQCQLKAEQTEMNGAESRYAHRNFRNEIEAEIHVALWHLDRFSNNRLLEITKSTWSRVKERKR